MERHALPLSPTARFSPIRGRYCLDDRCLRLEDADNMTVSDYIFDYSSSAYALRRPVPCPAGTYCHPGTAVGIGNMKNFSTPQPCFESMYCPEGSLERSLLPAGRYSPRKELRSIDEASLCPAGSYCPPGAAAPSHCPAGRFGDRVGLESAACPAAASPAASSGRA